MRSITYHGVTCVETATRTNIVRYAYGRRYVTTGRLWRLAGRIERDAGRRPFLTSAAACREYIRQWDDA